MAERKLNARQRKFISLYAGNATEAARLAGYAGTDTSLAVTGHQLLRKPNIALAIRSREDKQTAKGIMTREQRQAFWTSVAYDVNAKLPDRLRASELLGKSQADFTEKVEHSGTLSLEQLIAAAIIKP